MKVKKIKANDERQLLIGMIMSDSFLKKIIPIVKMDYFATKASATIGKWIIDYFSTYNVAPKNNIQDIFEENKKQIGKTDAEWISIFLNSLSKQYTKKGFNEAYLFDTSLKFFKRQNLKKNIKKIDKLLEKDKVEDAEKLWIESSKIPSSLDLGFEPFSIAAVDEMFKREKSRVKANLGIEALDSLLGPIKGGWFVLFMGPQKRGKTWSLIWTAISMVMQGLTVTFMSFEGEDEDWTFRAWMNIGSFIMEDKPMELEFPYFSSKNNDTVKYRKRKRPPLTKANVKQAIRRFNKLAPGRLILKSFPMGSAGMIDAEQYLDALEAYKGFSSHVHIFDYMGVMDTPSNERKERYNWTGMRMKALAHNKKTIAISGHQGKRETLEKLNMGVIDTPEDIRLLGHVDILIGINQTESERKLGIMRYTALIHRHKKYLSRLQSKVLQQLEAGQVALDSRKIKAPLPEDLDTGFDEDEGEPYA